MRMTLPPPPRSLWFLSLFILLGCYLASADNSDVVRYQDSCERNEDCKNGGTCELDPDTVHALNPLNKCQCVDRYWGPSCTQYCPIKCYNGGICQLKSNSVGHEHGAGLLDTNPDHYMCQCPNDWGGRQCQATVVVCADNTQCFNGGVCVVSRENTTSYKCSCPEKGDPENRCQDPVESRTYTKGPVRGEPTSEGGIVGIIVASIVAIVCAALLARMMRRRRHTSVMTEAFEEVDIDELREAMNARAGGYRDNVDDEADSSISLTEIN